MSRWEFDNVFGVRLVPMEAFRSEPMTMEWDLGMLSIKRVAASRCF